MKFLLFIGALIFSVTANAENLMYTSKIDKIYPLSDGRFILTFKNPSPECSREDHYFYVSEGKNEVNSDGVKNMLSVSLAAASMGKEIAIYFDKNSSLCSINRLSVSY